MSTIVMTVNDLADRQGVDYQTASGLIRFLREKGLAKEGKTRPTGGRGRGAQEYILSEKIEIDLTLIVEKKPSVVEEVAATVAETVVVPTPVETPVEAPVAAEATVPSGEAPVMGDDLMNDDDLIAA